ASTAGSANRKPSTSSALLSSAASRAREDSSSNGGPVATVCRQRSRRLQRSCDGGCTSRFPNKGNGWGKSSKASSTTTQFQQTGMRWEPFDRRSLTDGVGHLDDAAKRVLSPGLE